MQSFLFYETLLLIDFRVNHRLQLISTLFFFNFVHALHKGKTKYRFLSNKFTV